MPTQFIEVMAQVERHTLDLLDLHCPDCAATLQKDVSRLPGIAGAEVCFTAAQMDVRFDPGQTSLDAICHVVKQHGIRACPVQTSKREENADSPSRRARLRDYWQERERKIATAAAAILTLMAALPDPLTGRNLDTGLYAAAILVGGMGTLRSAFRALRTRAVDMNVLVALAVVGAAGIGEWSEGAIVVLLYNIGNLLQIGAMERTRRSLRALMELGPNLARVRRNGREESVPVAQVEIGEIILIRPGERIPTDGEIIAGQSALNEAAITGESLPADKSVGNRVFGGTLNGSGALEMRVTRCYEETLLAKIAHRVEEAHTERAPAQQFIDRFARWYTPLVVGLAFAVAVFPPLAYLTWQTLHGLPTEITVWTHWYTRSLALLLIACPCALVISTPVAIVTAIGSASRNGVLIKGGAYLEILATLRVMLFDKTGTLTQGRCRVAEVVALNEAAPIEILTLTAALELQSEHPLAAAFAHAAQHRTAQSEVQHFAALPGRGVRGEISGQVYLLGNLRLMQEFDINTRDAQAHLDRLEAAGHTAILLATPEQVLGIIAIADTPREEAADALRELKSLGVTRQAMLTGDNARAAQAVANAVGMAEVRAGLLPEDKLTLVREFQKKYGAVGMVGDGINDAPALAAADVGIVMGMQGNDTAMETADVALMTDDLSRLVYAIRLSRRARAIIRQNVAFSLVTKGAC